METNASAGQTFKAYEVTQVLAAVEVSGNKELLAELESRVTREGNDDVLVLDAEETEIIAWLFEEASRSKYYGKQSSLMVEAMKRQFDNLRSSAGSNP